MPGGENRIDGDGLEWIDRPLRSVNLVLQHIQQLPEPPLASHLPHQRGVRLHPLGLAHGRFMLLGQLQGNGDGVEWIDDDSLHGIFRELGHAILLPFGNAVHLFNLL